MKTDQERKILDRPYRRSIAYVELFSDICTSDDVVNLNIPEEVRSEYLGKLIYKFHLHNFAEFAPDFRAYIFDKILSMTSTFVAVTKRDLQKSLELIRHQSNINFLEKLLRDPKKDTYDLPEDWEEEFQESREDVEAISFLVEEIEKKMKEKRVRIKREKIKNFSDAVKKGYTIPTFEGQKLYHYYLALLETGKVDELRTFLITEILKLPETKKFKPRSTSYSTKTPIIPVDENGLPYLVGLTLFEKRKREEDIEALRAYYSLQLASASKEEKEKAEIDLKNIEKEIQDIQEKYAAAERQRNKIKEQILKDIWIGKYDKILGIANIVVNIIKTAQKRQVIWFDLEGNEFVSEEQLIAFHSDWIEDMIAFIVTQNWFQILHIVVNAFKTLDKFVEQFNISIIEEELISFAPAYQPVPVAADFIEQLIKVADLLDEKKLVNFANSIDNIIFKVTDVLKERR